MPESKGQNERSRRMIVSCYSDQSSSLLSDDAPERSDPNPPQPAEDEWNGLELALKFHEYYEQAAPSFGYETRPETRRFDPESDNGKLMIHVCNKIAEQHNVALTPVQPAEDLEETAREVARKIAFQWFDKGEEDKVSPFEEWVTSLILTALRGATNGLRQELTKAKTDADNWFRQYKAMKCAGDTDLEQENADLQSQLAVKERECEELKERNHNQLQDLVKIAHAVGISATVGDSTKPLLTTVKSLQSRLEKADSIVATLLNLLQEAHERIGNTSWPSLAARIVTALDQIRQSQSEEQK